MVQLATHGTPRDGPPNGKLNMQDTQAGPLARMTVSEALADERAFLVGKLTALAHAGHLLDPLADHYASRIVTLDAEITSC